MHRTYIIAEAGVNHNGSPELAKKLIDKAKEAGVDCVKFQTFNPRKLTTKSADKADYQVKNTNNDEKQLDMLDKLALSQKVFVDLKEYCEEKGIEFLSTPFDFESIDFLDNLGVSFWKVPSGEITNYPYLVKIAQTRRDIVLSTGMASMEEVEAAYKLLKDKGSGEITLLHCTTEYPAPIEDVNLKAMLSMKEKFGCKVGYSDHTKGIEIPVAAVAMGAEVIEKHFTLDRNMEGPDHKASLEPDELKEMVTAIRNVEKALGNGEKVPSPSEIKNKPIARKSIVAKKDIKAGELFTEDNITTKRPGSGINPMLWTKVLGTRAIRDFKEDELIEI